MIRALIRKELRELLPWGILSLVVGLLAIGPYLFRAVDTLPLGQTFGDLQDTIAVIFWAMGLAIGTGLATREHADGTLVFLDGLPVTRTRLFIVKSAVILGLVLAAPLIRFTVIALLHIYSRGSLDHDLHLDLLLQLFALQALLIASGVFVGAAFGSLRSLTWLALGVAAVVLRYLIHELPHTAVLNPLTLLSARITATGLSIDARTVWVQVALALGGWLIAWGTFISAGKRRQLPALAHRPVVSAVVSVTTVVVVGVAVLSFWWAQMGGARQDGGVADYSPYFVSSPPALTETRHYRISYPSDQSELALALAERADAIFERVHTLLHVPPGARIDVDASGSSTNTLGTAFYERIRVRLDADMNIVLSHETSHVVARRLAGGERAYLWDRAAVLNEGLATWVHHHFEADSRSREQGLFELAALHYRRELLMDELANPALLAQLRSQELQYPAGEALIAAVVRLYGAPALPRLLRAFADKRLPNDMEGMPMWQAVFQTAGMNLGAVIDAFYREVETVMEREAARIAALPRPRVRLVEDLGDIGVEALIDRPLKPSERLILRFKPTAESSLDTIETNTVTVGEPVWREDKDVSLGRVCVQAGFGMGEVVLYEPWVCLPVSEAQPWVSSTNPQLGVR